jgi:hypothetical protein
MQPNRIGIAPDELIGVHPVDFLRAPDPVLLPIHEVSKGAVFGCGLADFLSQTKHRRRD